MDGNFSIDVDVARSLVRIRMSGLFSREQVLAFVKARNAAHARLTCPPNMHVTLNDIRDMKIQPQETVAAFREILGDPAYRSRRLAFVTRQTLARQQLLRALDSRDGRCFDDAVEAEAWLVEADAQSPNRVAA